MPSRNLPNQLADSLAGVVGAGHVLTSADVTSSYGTDWTGRWKSIPEIVVRPASTEEVAAVVAVCRGAGAAIVPQGGNTGLVGGSVPHGSEVVLSLRRMTGVEEVDRADSSVVVEAGVTLGCVQRHAGEAGLSAGIDLAARESATIGGMAATDAGGVHVLRHGRMQSRVIALEAVLADSSVVGRLPALRKDNAGYDLSSLFVGSEGTLALVTRVQLSLIPAPAETAVALLAFEQMGDAVASLGSLRSVDGLSALELIDGDSLDQVAAHRDIPPPFPTYHAVHLLVEVSGPAGCAGALIAALDRPGPWCEAAVALSGPEVARLWQWREGIPEAVASAGIPRKIDVGVPLRRVGTFMDEVRRRVAGVAPAAEVFVFGHAGDGNLHVNVLGLDGEGDRVEAEVLALSGRLGGTVSAEHGIGVAKRRWLHLTRSASEIRAMRALKSALDPLAMLNPGVLLPDFPGPS